jgi:hypothetical protein
MRVYGVYEVINQPPHALPHPQQVRFFKILGRLVSQSCSRKRLIEAHFFKPKNVVAHIFSKEKLNVENQNRPHPTPCPRKFSGKRKVFAQRRQPFPVFAQLCTFRKRMPRQITSSTQT